MEYCINNCILELNNNELFEMSGGTFWGVVGGVATTVGGVAGVVGGAALLAAPEPTGVTKFLGGSSIAGDVAGIAGGLATIGSNV